MGGHACKKQHGQALRMVHMNVQMKRRQARPGVGTCRARVVSERGQSEREGDPEEMVAGEARPNLPRTRVRTSNAAHPRRRGEGARSDGGGAVEGGGGLRAALASCLEDTLLEESH